MNWVTQIPDCEALQRLRSGLGLIGSGCAEDFTTRLVPRAPRGHVNLNRHVVAQSFSDATECDSYPALISAEERQRSKHGTYSRRPPYRTPDGTGVSLELLVRRYFEPHHCRMTSGKALLAADKAVEGLYDVCRGKLNLCTLSVAEVAFLQSKTGLGWPVFSSDRSFLPQVRDESARIIRASYPRESVHYYPGVVGFRGQPRGPGPFCKFRVIYQGSRVIGNLEKMIQIPLLKALRGSKVFCAWEGRAAVDAAVHSLLVPGGKPLVSIDFANFDASIPEPIIRRVFGIISTWFNRSWHPHIKYVSDTFCGCGIFTPGGFLEGEGRQGGVPSGSVLTNLIDSLVNYWVMNYAVAYLGGRILDALVQGDDGVYRFSGTNHSKVADVLLSEFGMILSVEKSLVSNTEVHFLQNVHHLCYKWDGVCVGVRPLMRVLNGMMSYEDLNRSWDKQYDSFRWLQQLENASYHPGFEKACDWLLANDPCMCSALAAIYSNDRSLLDKARQALCGKHEWNKIAVDGLGASRVFQVMSAIAAKKG